MIQKLQTTDRYSIFSESTLTSLDRKVLSCLYQPIIGYKAMSFYFTLWGEIEIERRISTTSTHNRLLKVMGCNLSEIIEMREALEAISLIKTYLKEKDGEIYYYYVLYAPKTSQEFFSHDILNSSLYNVLGNNDYEKTEFLFLKNNVDIDEGYIDISKKFNDVYSINMSLNKNNKKHFDRSELDFSLEYDFEKLQIELKNFLIPGYILTDDVKNALKSLYALYELDVVVMARILADSLQVKGNKKQVDLMKLKESAKTSYELQILNTELVLIHNRQTPSLTSHLNYNKYSYLKDCDQLPVYDYYYKLNKGNVSEGVLKTIESVMVKTNLNPAIINVIMHYIFKKNNYLNLRYFESICQDWKDKGMVKAIEACEYLENLNQKQPQSKEPLPEWYQNNEQVNPTSTLDVELLAKQMREL